MNNTWPMKCHIRAEAGATRVDVFDDIGEGSWFSEGLSAKDFAAQLAGVKGPLDVHINSYGGDVGHGIAIGNTIRTYKGFKRTVVDGMAASIASVIAQAGDERVVEPGSMVFVHDAFTACVGNAADMAKAAEDLNKHSDNLAEIYASRAGGTTQHWRDIMQAETWYTAEEAVAAGLADKIGTEAAVLPAGLDLAAFTALPGRIAAALRAMPAAAPQPQDAARHDPMKGTHSHAHPAYGSQGGDSLHSHEHTHDGDASHSHSHADGGEDDAGAADHGDRLEGHGAQKVQLSVTGPGGEGFREALQAWLRENIGAAAGAPGSHGDHERFDPDGDGDCDAWAEDGTQLKSVPGKPMPAGALTADGIRVIVREEILAIVREEILGAADGIDNSPWDASKAWHNGAEADDPAAFYAGICAGQKAGDKATQSAWALPYKYHPGDAVNAAGVKAALGRLPQTEGLTNAAEAKATLQAAMKKVNPDYEPEDSAGDGPQDGDGDHSGSDLEQIRTAFKALEGAFE